MHNTDTISLPSSTPQQFPVPFTLESGLWWDYPTYLDSRSYQFSEMGTSSQSSYGSISVDPRLLTRSTESREAGPIIEVPEDPFDEVKRGGEIADGSSFTGDLSFLRLQGDHHNSGQAEMMDPFTMYDNWSDDTNEEFYWAGGSPVSTISTKQEISINSVSPESALFTPPQNWSLHENTTVNPSFLPSPLTFTSPSPLSTRHIAASSSQNTKLTITDILNDDSDETPNTSNDYYNREHSLSPVPIDFEQRTPIMKVFDSITVISTPSPLPSSITQANTPRHSLNRTRIIDAPQPRIGRPPRRKNKSKRVHETRRSSRLHYEKQPEEQEELVVGPLTEEEFNRVYEMKNASRYYTWRDIGRELNRDWRQVRMTWRKTRKWDENKVLSLYYAG